MKDSTITALVISFILSLTLILMFGIPNYMVWYAGYKGRATQIKMEYEGKAILAKSQHSRMVKIETAKAERDSAKLTAEAIEIVGRVAMKYPEYRQQEFIMAFGEALREGNISQIIYVPTEANIPIIEAGKRH